MAGRRVHVVMPAGLVEMVDAELKPGESRGEWVRGAIEQRLARRLARVSGGREAFERALASEASPSEARGVSSRRLPAPAEQPVSRSEMFKRVTQ